MQLKKRKGEKVKKSNKKSLTEWDWDTLVAAWRYYQYRMTISSAGFPEDIIKRYFTGDYTDEACQTIARQFYETDHGLHGERDWSESSCLSDCDKLPWCKFYAFCKAYCEGFKTVVLDGENRGKHLHDEPECFYCEYSKRWYPKKDYLSKPWEESYCGEEFIKEIKS